MQKSIPEKLNNAERFFISAECRMANTLMTSRKWLAFAGVFLVGGAVVATLSQRAPSPAPPLQAPSKLDLTAVDRELPAFELPALDETLWTAETLRNKPWIVNFWATWCAPCIEEIPSMNAAYEALQPEGIGMLAINVGEGAEAVEEFMQKIPIEFSNVLGDASTLQDWSLSVLPTTLVVNAEGKIIYEAIGSREWDNEELLQRIVDSM